MKRLRAMGGEEILFRVGREVACSAERLRIARGWAPQPARPVASATSLIDAPESFARDWHRAYGDGVGAYDTLLGGTVELFGHLNVPFDARSSWHTDPTSGVAAPLSYGKKIDYRDGDVVGNVKIIWELGRHQHLVPHAVALAVGADDGSHARAIAGQIDGWIAQNPYGRGIHWCSSLELAIRLISWAVVHSLVALRTPGGLFSLLSDPEAFGRSVFQQAHFIRNYVSRHSSANNHSLGEWAGLWIACRTFDLGRDGDRWAREARVNLERESAEQTYADGVNKEQAFHYHQMVLELFLLAWIVGRRCGDELSTEFEARIGAMADFLDEVRPRGGTVPLVGDADDGLVTRFEPRWPADPYEEVSAAVDVALARKPLPADARGLPQKAFWYALMAGRAPAVADDARVPGESPRDEALAVVEYPQAGYAVVRSGPAHLLFDAGPLGFREIAAHGHADALSFCLAIGGQWWLVDPGTYCYHTERPWRDYFRGTSAHNTLRVDGRDQSVSGGTFLWTAHANATLYGAAPISPEVVAVRGSHDGYRRLGVAHRREVRVDGPGSQVIVEDIVAGEGHHDLELFFHFAPQVTLAHDAADTHWSATLEGSPYELTLELDAAWRWSEHRGSLEPRLGWYSERLEQKQPCSTLRGVWSGALPGAPIRSILRWRNHRS